MKKVIGTILVVMIWAAVVYATGVVVYAQDVTTRSTTISTTVSPKYTVTIPPDTAITYGNISTLIGNISVTALQLEVNKQLTVTASSTGSLKNSADASKVIPYLLKSGNNTFTTLGFTEVGSVALKIDITQDAWNAAAPGNYTDSITFTFSYTSIL